MDQRFWSQKKKIPIYNVRDDVAIPAYAAVVFSYDYGSQGIPPPFSEAQGTLKSGQIIYPVRMGVAETRLWNAMYAINGPVEIPPNGYGEASIDYPLPLLVDPNTFPIGYSPPTPGSWAEYMSAYAPDAEGAPICGPASPNVLGAASFMPTIPMWQCLAWDINEDGSDAPDRMIVILKDPADTYVTGFQQPFGFALDSVAAQSPHTFFNPLTISAQGLYSVFVSCGIQTDVPGNEVLLKIGVKNGQINLGSEPPGAFQYFWQAGRRPPAFTVGDSTDLSYYPNDADKVVYQDPGYETVSFSGPLYLRPTDTVQLDLISSQSSKIAVYNGLMWIIKAAANPLSWTPGIWG